MTTWDDISKVISTVVTVLSPIASPVVPGAAAAIAIGTKIIQGVIAAEPTAVALFNRIKSGEQVSAAELQQYASDYEAAYQQLAKNIADRLAAMPTS